MGWVETVSRVKHPRNVCSLAAQQIQTLTQKIGVNFVPVEGGEWGTEIGVLVVI